MNAQQFQKLNDAICRTIDAFQSQCAGTTSQNYQTAFHGQNPGGYGTPWWPVSAFGCGPAPAGYNPNACGPMFQPSGWGFGWTGNGWAPANAYGCQTWYPTSGPFGPGGGTFAPTWNTGGAFNPWTGPATNWSGQATCPPSQGLAHVPGFAYAQNTPYAFHGLTPGWTQTAAYPTPFGYGNWTPQNYQGFNDSMSAAA